MMIVSILICRLLYGILYYFLSVSCFYYFLILDDYTGKMRTITINNMNIYNNYKLNICEVSYAISSRKQQNEGPILTSKH